MTATLERPSPGGRPTPRHAAPPAPAAPEDRFRLDIGGMRALAVLLVVLYHAKVPGISAGYVGVDVFFVISGFLITGQIVREVQADGRLKLGRFYARRMRRLLPAALLVIVVTAVAARFWGPLLQVRATATDSIWAALYGINFHLAAEGVDYQQAAGPQSPLQHFWSLAVEEQFYLVWPLLIILATVWFAHRMPRGVRPVLTMLALAAGAVSLYLSVVVTARSAPDAYFSVQTRAWEFMAGALVALAAPLLARIARPLAAVGSWVGLGAVVAAALVYDDSTPFPGTAALLPVGGAALLIACGCRGNGADRAGAARILKLRPAQWIGKVSYGWYLWHWPVLIIAPSVLGYELSWVRAVELSVLSLWLGALTHFVVELPTQRKRLRTGRWLAIGVVLSLGAVGAGVLVQNAANGVAGNGRYAAPLDLSTPHSIALRRALLTASRATAVPGNLTPTLEDAGDDQPVTTSDDCHLDFLETRIRPCVFGDVSATRTVVIVGDSHAQQWDGAFIAAAKASRWRVVSWTKAACPIADVSLVNPDLKRRYSECDSWRQDVLARITSMKPALVIASQSDSVPGKSLSSQDWAFKTAAAVKTLTDAGIPVTYLADTPYPRTDVPACVADNLSDATACGVSRADAYHGAYGSDATLYTQRHRVMVSSLREAGITVVDPVTWLCSATVCPVIVGNTLVYRDSSHLTDTYSSLLGPVVEPILAKAGK